MIENFASHVWIEEPFLKYLSRSSTNFKTKLSTACCIVQTVQQDINLIVTALIIIHPCFLKTVPLNHWRSIKIEEMAKVVAPVWGTESIQFLAALAIFHQDDFEEKDK